MRSSVTQTPITPLQAELLSKAVIEAALAGMLPAEITKLRKALMRELKTINTDLLAGQTPNAGS